MSGLAVLGILIGAIFLASGVFWMIRAGLEHKKWGKLFEWLGGLIVVGLVIWFYYVFLDY
jgi:hypothetical protein